jgi:hypothetical protein
METATTRRVRVGAFHGLNKKADHNSELMNSIKQQISSMISSTEY